MGHPARARELLSVVAPLLLREALGFLPQNQICFNLLLQFRNEKKDSKTNNINFRIPLQALDLCLHVINDSENLYHFKNANIKKETILSFVNQLSVDRDSIENFIMSNDNNQDYAIYLTQLHNQIGNIDKTIESINQSYS